MRESQLEIPPSARFEMDREQAGIDQSAEVKITDAGRQRLETIKGGFRSFKEGLVNRFKGMGKGIETGVVNALSAPEAAAAGGRAVGHAAAETGRAVKHGAEKVGREVRHGTEATLQRGRETVGTGKDWVVDRASDIGQRAVALRDQFTTRVEQIRENARQAHEAWKTERQTQREYNEYVELCSERDELVTKLNRLSQLERKFGSAPAE